MTMRDRSNIPWVSAVLTAWCLCAPALWAEPDPNTPTDPCTVADEPALWAAPYRDILAGLSFHPPAEAMVYREATPAAPPQYALPPLADWPALKTPPSKALLTMFDPAGHYETTVQLLTTNDEITLAALTEARQSLWAELIEPNAVRSIEITLPTDAETTAPARLHVPQVTGQDPCSTYQVTEFLLPTQPKQFLLISWLAAPDVDVSPLGEAVQASVALADETQIKTAWSQAHKQTGRILAQFTFDDLAAAREETCWQVHQGEAPVAFLLRSDRLHQDPCQSPRLEMRYTGYAETALVAEALARGMGWGIWPMGQKIPLAGPVVFDVYYDLKDTSPPEECVRIRLADGTGSPRTVEQQARRQENRLLLKTQDDPTKPDELVEEALPLGPSVHVPRIQMPLLSRLLSQESTARLVFSTYANGAVTQQTWQLDEADAHRQLIRQEGVDGPVIRAMLDEQGRVLWTEMNGLRLTTTTEDALQERWAEPMKQLTELTADKP